MSNVIRRKKKKSNLPKDIQKQLNDSSSIWNKKLKEEQMLIQMQSGLNSIVLWVAHDQLGFARKRILKLTAGIERTAADFREKKITPEKLGKEIEKKFGLDMYEKSKEISLREKLKVLGINYPKSLDEVHYMALLVNASFEAVFNILITVLHTNFKVSKAKINDFIEQSFEHIHLLYKDEFTLKDLDEQLLLEIGLKNEEKPDDKS